MLTTIQELQTTALLLCAGVILGLLYDGLRIFRLALGAKKMLCMVTDAIFWPTAFMVLFYFSYMASAGDFRLVSLILIFCGSGLYFLGVSKIILRLVKPLNKGITTLKNTKAFKYLFK